MLVFYGDKRTSWRKIILKSLPYLAYFRQAIIFPLKWTSLYSGVNRYLKYKILYTILYKILYSPCQRYQLFPIEFATKVQVVPLKLFYLLIRNYLILSLFRRKPCPPKPSQRPRERTLSTGISTQTQPRLNVDSPLSRRVLAGMSWSVMNPGCNHQ